MLFSYLRNSACQPGGHYWYNFSLALSLIQVIATQWYRVSLTYRIAQQPGDNKTANQAMFSSKSYIICIEKCEILEAGQVKIF